MRSIVFCVLCLQVAWGYGYPSNSRGVGTYAFSDSSGRRYGGTYDLKDGKVVSSTGNFPSAGSYPSAGIFPTAGNFPPTGNYPVPFGNNYQGYGFGIRSRRAFLPPLPPLPPFRPFQRLKPFRPFSLTRRFQPYNDMPGFSDFDSSQNYANNAYASAAAGPGYSHQIAAISPVNPDQPNVNKASKFSDTPSQGNFYSVSSSSYATSSNVDGQEKSARGAETTVNNNGKITTYKVES